MKALPQPVKTSKNQDKLEESKCAVCGSVEISGSFKSKSIISGEREEFRFVECRRCDLVYLNPRPGPEFMTRLYSQNICPGFTPREKMTRTTARREKIMRRVEINSNRAKVKRIRRRIELSADSRVLDVGSLTGAFLRAAQIEAGCSVQGVDISGTAAEYVKKTYNIPVAHADFLDYDDEAGSFDCITMWHMLEHAYEPAAMLSRARTLLNDDGLLVVEIPNLDNWYWRYLKGDWVGHLTPSHLHGFSPSNLEKLLRDNGFEPVEISSPVHFPFFFISLVARRLQFIDARFFEKHLFTTMFALLADLPLVAVSKFNGRGGAILAYARKS